MRRSVLVVLLVCGAVFGAEMTFLGISGMPLDVPAGAYVFLGVYANGPIPDYSYTGTARLHLIEENPNGSAFFFDPITTETDTVWDITVSSSDDINILLCDSEPEFIAVYAEDVAGVLKPSLPVGITVLPSGDEPIRMGHLGPTSLPLGGEDLFVPLRLGAVDSAGRIVPSYYSDIIVFDAISVRILPESDPDGSASFVSLFDETETDSAAVAAVGGMGYIFLRSSSALPETVTLVISDLVGSLPAETLDVAFVDYEPFLIAGPPEGIAQTVGFPQGIIAFGVGAGEPEFHGDTSVVGLLVKDMFGAPSATAVPESASLSAGVAIFSLIDDEPDTFAVFVRPYVIHGTDLYAPFWATAIFLPPGRASALVYRGPSVLAVGDTVEVQVCAVDAYGTHDPSYEGYIDVGDLYFSGAVDVLSREDASPLESQFIPLEGGLSTFLLTGLAPGEVAFQIADAEERGLFENGLLSPAPEVEMSVIPVSASAAGMYRLFPPNSFLVFEVGRSYRFDIAAVDDAGAVDKTYSGNVAVEVSGSAVLEPPDGIVPMVDGFGSFEIRDDVAEDVTLYLAGELSSPDTFVLHFIEAGAGGVAVVVEDLAEGMIAGQERELVVVVFSPSGFASMYSGVAAVSVFDPDGDGSVTCPDSVVFSGGVASLPFRNADAETVAIVVSAEGLVPVESRIATYAVLSAELPGTLSTGVENVILLRATDVDGEVLADVDAEIVPSVVELGAEDGSVTIPSTVPMVAGTASFVISDDENEEVELYLASTDFELFTVPDAPYDDERGWYIGTVYFSSEGVVDKVRPAFRLGRLFPNPLNSSFSVAVELPAPGALELSVVDISGHLLRSEVRELPAGSNTVRLDAGSLPTGVYVLRLSFGGRVVARKFAVVK